MASIVLSIYQYQSISAWNMFMGPYSDTDMTTFSKYRSISSIMIKGDGSLLSSPIWLTSLSSLYLYSNIWFSFLYINLYFKTCKYFRQKINLLTYLLIITKRQGRQITEKLLPSTTVFFSKQLIYFIKTDVIRNFYFAAFKLIKKTQQYYSFLVNEKFGQKT